jgi:hypothetical protein
MRTAVVGDFLRSIDPVVAVALVAAAVAPSMALAWQWMRRQGAGDRTNDVTAGARFLGVFFAILTGFLLVTTFGSVTDARDAADGRCRFDCLSPVATLVPDGVKAQPHRYR